MESWVQSWRPCTNAFFGFFPLHLSKVLRLPRKSDARSYVLHLSRKIISANLKIWCSKMQPLSGNQGPDLLTALMNMSLVLCLPREMHLCRSSSNVPRLPSFLEMLQNSHVLLTFDNAHNPLRLPRKTTSERPKVLRTPQFFALLTSKCASRHNGVHFFDISTSKSGPNLVCVLYILTSKCASRHNGVHFFDISTSKSGPNMRCFVHFEFHMCFIVLRATTACTFLTAQLLKVLQSWGVLYILTCKCASRHNGVQFFISHLASWLRTRRFSEPTFRPSGATNHWKNTVFRDVPTFSHTWSSFFWDFLFLLLFSSLTLPISAFHLSILWLLNFLRS